MTYKLPHVSLSVKWLSRSTRSEDTSRPVLASSPGSIIIDTSAICLPRTHTVHHMETYRHTCTLLVTTLQPTYISSLSLSGFSWKMAWLDWRKSSLSDFSFVDSLTMWHGYLENIQLHTTYKAFRIDSQTGAKTSSSYVTLSSIGSPHTNRAVAKGTTPGYISLPQFHPPSTCPCDIS